MSDAYRLRFAFTGTLHRVVVTLEDDGIMPTITSGNTNAPAIMIGEKGADAAKASRASGR